VIMEDEYLPLYVPCQLDFAIGSIVLRDTRYCLVKCMVIDHVERNGFSMVGVRDLDDDQYFQCYPEQLEYS
jgi:hypothetical protein